MQQATYDLLIVGAGPAGLSTAIEAQRHGLRAIVIDQGGVVDHIRQYPIGMAFFSSRSMLELAGIPFDSQHRYPTREDMLSYCARVAQITGIELRTGQALGAVTGSDGAFIATVGTQGARIRTRKIVIATGVFGQVRRMTGVPGLELSKVRYGYQDPHEASGLDVVIVGAGNGAAEAAVRLFHAGARVTVLHRNEVLAESKWRWRLDDIAALVQAGAIRMIHRAALQRIEPAGVVIEAPDGVVTLPNDRVILLLGFEPASALFDRLGIAYDPATLVPHVDPLALESSVPGIYLAGVVLAGRAPDRVFIHGSRHHGKAIVGRITGKPALPIEDRGLDTTEHWRQFEYFEDQLDPEIALDLVPVVVGDHRDNLVDVYSYRALRAGRSVGDDLGPLGPVVDAMEGWLFRSGPDGAGVLHGRQLSSDALDLLRRADGTRRIRDIVAELAEEVELSLEQLSAMVVSAFLVLLRSGTVTWRPSRLPDHAACQSR